MKNKFKIFLIVCLFLQKNLFANELDISSNKIKVLKDSQEVRLSGNVNAKDVSNNNLKTEEAIYDKKKQLLQTLGSTEIITSNNYRVEGSLIFFDNINKKIFSEKSAKVYDIDGNTINVENFQYSVKNNIFVSKGKIEVNDINKNNYFFSEIYIDEKKNKIVGTDVKAFLNQKDLKIDSRNEPRFFSNSAIISKNESEFQKGVFTYCKKRDKEKCPPWEIRSNKIKHNNANKTIYYDKATLKVYDFPIFFFPYLSHPDPTVKRRSGFLIPSLNDSTSLGASVTVPYYLNISNDKDLTFTPKLYGRENPLVLAEYRQAFENSYLIIDSGYTKGYKDNTAVKTKGSRSHFFSKYSRSLIGQNESISNFNLDIQTTSNDTYLKAHDIDTLLAKSEIDVLENNIEFDYQKEDLYFGASISAFEDMTVENNSKYEYLFPYLTINKNLFVDENYGIMDFTSNFRVRNYDVNKQTELFVNDFEWQSNKWSNSFGVQNQFKTLLKTVNYEAKNASNYKTDKLNSELSAAFGYLADLSFYKNNLKTNSNHLIKPKLLLRYAPGHMRRLDTGNPLKYSNLFNFNKTQDIDVIETGLSAALGVEYKNNTLLEDGVIGEEKFALAIGQVINSEENEKINPKTSLNQRFSDVVGESNYLISKNLKLNYNFSLDQNYNDFNYNEISSDFISNNTKFNIGYLEEKNHIGNQEYIKTKFEVNLNDTGSIDFSTKRNLLTNSAEFYNLSYNYINDCLKAGILYRREFYTDRDIEPENSLMFTISIVPIGDINSPKFDR